MKIAIVTGGAKGLGETISKNLSENGYKVYVVSRNPGTGSENLITKKVDISKEASCKKLVKEISRKEKRLDLLVNNAGVNDKNNIEKTFAVNVFGAFFLIKNSVGLLKKSKGKVVNITSLNGLVPTPESTVYSASKHAIEGLGIAISYELANQGVSVTNIAPGAIFNPKSKALSHMPLREKYSVLKFLFPLTTRQIVSDRVLKVAKQNSSPKRVVIGIDAVVAHFLYRTIPFFWFWLVKKLYSN